MATARMPSRTPSTGLVTANQKEMFQPDSWAIEFVFTPFSQAFEKRHFRKHESFFRDCFERGTQHRTSSDVS
jgi:hypothetical protein